MHGDISIGMRPLCRSGSLVRLPVPGRFPETMECSKVQPVVRMVVEGSLVSHTMLLYNGSTKFLHCAALFDVQTV